MMMWVHTRTGRKCSAESDDYGAIVANADLVDQLCDLAGVRKLSEYFVDPDSELEGDDADRSFEPLGLGDLESDRQVLEEAEAANWFDASEGLNTVRAVRQLATSERPADLGDQDLEVLVDELDGVAVVLEGLAAQGGTFRLMAIG